MFLISILFFNIILCGYNDIAKHVDNFILSKTFTNPDWPFSKCRLDVDCPKHWHCNTGDCLPDDEEYWTFEIESIRPKAPEFLELVLYSKSMEESFIIFVDYDRVWIDLEGINPVKIFPKEKEKYLLYVQKFKKVFETR